MPEPLNATTTTKITPSHLARSPRHRSTRKRLEGLRRETDENGSAIVYVPLATKGDREPLFAKLFADDYVALAKAGWAARSWFINSGLVRTINVDGINQTIARLLMEPCPGERVIYANQDRLDLRRTNLLVEWALTGPLLGQAKKDGRSLLPLDREYRRRRVYVRRFR